MLQRRRIVSSTLTILALVALFVIAAPSASAGVSSWTSSGLTGKNIAALGVDPKNPTTVYAGGYGGLGDSLFRSNDDGVTWNAVTSFPMSTVRSFAFDPATPTIYVGGCFAISRSKDNGSTWSSVTLGTGGLCAENIVIDPRDAKNLFATALPQTVPHLFHSTDGGDTWNDISNHLPTNSSVSPLAIDPTTATIYTGGSEIYRSTDNGTTWITTTLPSVSDPAGLIINTLAVNSVSPSVLYTGTNRGVFRSNDRGDSWVFSGSGLPPPAFSNPSPFPDITILLINPNTPTTLYAVTNNLGVFRSTNGGDNWVSIHADSLPNFSMQAVALKPSDSAILYAAPEGANGVYQRTEDNTPTLSAQPLSQRIRPGTAVTLDVVGGSGTQPFSYQWYEGVSGDTSRPVSGATGRTFATPSLNANTAYWVQVSNSVGSVNSDTAQMNVKGAYTPSLDGFNSNRAFSNFGYTPGDAIPGASWDIFKRTFPATSMELPNGQPKFGAQAYFRSTAYRSLGAGDCFGMSAVSMLRYLDSNDTTEQATLNPFYRRFTQISDLPPIINGAVTVGQSNVKDYIFLYQGRQQSKQIQEWLHSQNTPAQTFDAIRQITQAGNVAILVFSVPGVGHAVVAYSTQQVGNVGTIAIYDPNWPGDTTRQITVDLSTNQWRYELWPGTTWSGSTNLSYVPVSMLFPADVSLSQQAPAPLLASDTGITLGVEGDADLLITDSEGHQFGPTALDPTQEISGALRLVNASFNPDQPNATSPRGLLSARRADLHRHRGRCCRCPGRAGGDRALYPDNLWRRLGHDHWRRIVGRRATRHLDPPRDTACCDVRACDRWHLLPDAHRRDLDGE